jgi:hypothetical protein
MAERELEAGVRRVDLEERQGPGQDRERRALVADADHLQDAKPSTVEGDLARPTIEPIGSNPDLDRLDSDHRHFAAPFRGRYCELRSPGTGAVNACSISDTD